jgi:hypothetical protein
MKPLQDVNLERCEHESAVCKSDSNLDRFEFSNICLRETYRNIDDSMTLHHWVVGFWRFGKT